MENSYNRSVCPEGQDDRILAVSYMEQLVKKMGFTVTRQSWTEVDTVRQQFRLRN